MTDRNGASRDESPPHELTLRMIRPAPSTPAPPAAIWRRRAELPLPPALRHDGDLDYTADRLSMLPGNRLRLLVDGDQAFPAMLSAIRGARSFVHLETYIFEPDHIGRAFADALAERARAGVHVRLLYDAIGGWTLSSGFVADLRRAGVEVLVYRPLTGRRAWGRWVRRDHRKILVVDGVIAFTGGLNIGDDYARLHRGDRAWRDTHARIEGPVVARFEAMFRDTWQREGGRPYPACPPESRESVAVADSVYAAAVGSDDRGNRTAIRREYLHAIRHARDYIYIANAYFVPDGGIRRALSRAARRGVRVHVLTSKRSDLRSVQLAGEHTYGALLKSGVHIHLWPGTNMHAKTAVVDGVWSSVGSYNLDYVSLFSNLEVVLVAVGRGFGTLMREAYERDLARAEALTHPGWRRRGQLRRLLEWTLYRFRRWL